MKNANKSEISSLGKLCGSAWKIKARAFIPAIPPVET